MKITPEKPHFFKPILPGFNDRLKIPQSFLKYLGGKRYDRAVLRRDTKEWRVKVNERFLFGEGWSRFALENDLEVGDFLVFRHGGNMVFDVLVFDDTHLEKENPASYAEGNADPIEAGENPPKKMKFNG